MQKSIKWLKENWIFILIGSVTIYILWKKVLLKLWNKYKIMKELKVTSENEKYNPDYNTLAMLLHDALNKGWFGFWEDEDAVMGIINALHSQDEFLLLAMAYAKKYSVDMREKIRKHFTDEQYGKLLYK